MIKSPSTTPVEDRWFLNDNPTSIETYQTVMQTAQEVIGTHFANLKQPYSGASVEQLRSLLQSVEICPQAALDVETVLQQVGTLILHHSVAIHHPACAAHLHCPPLIPSLAAEAIISATNQSMDSWDQSPAATLLEERIIRWLCQRFQLHEGDGVFTSGGTQSNFMGLLLARNHYLQTHFGWNAQQQGLPPNANLLRILCSEAAHFTIKQSAALLGLGEQAVVPVKTDTHHRLLLSDLEDVLVRLRSRGAHPIAIVGTVGTTDFGSIDPLRELGTYARQEGMWFHVDAAYGGALAFSPGNTHRLAGMEQADSITIDFHKLFYQPISCGACLVRNASSFDWIKGHADYLNPAEDEDCGIPNLVGKSVQTTRRFDALKLFVSLRTLGQEGIARMIDHTLAIAQEAARIIRIEPKLESKNPVPSLNTVIFRYLPDPDPAEDRQTRTNRINRAIRQQLLLRGDAVIAQTKVQGTLYLKLTLLNPRTSVTDVQGILDSVKRIGAQLESRKGVCPSYVPSHCSTTHHAKLP